MKQGGGNQPTIPLYKEPKNSPFVPNEQKKIYGERLAETLPPQTYTQGQGQGGQQPIRSGFGPGPGQGKQNEPMVNLQIYQPQKPPAPKPMDISTFAPIAMPTPFFPPQFSYQYAQSQHPLQPINVIKSYTINATGPTGDHTKLNMVYEDALPNKQFSGTANTLAERLTMQHYIRAIMFGNGDGNDISLDGSGPDSLISHLKFIDLNPFNTYKFSKNPYKGMPKNMLLYRSCYPVRHDPAGGTVTCSRDSMGMNIRIYKLTQGEYMVNKQIEKNYLDYETWREIAYYEFIGNQLIKTKVCPNFISMYGYHIADKCNIDFDKIALIRGEQTISQPQYVSTVPYANPIKNSTSLMLGGGTTGGILGNDIIYNINPDAFTGKALIVLTESPNYNLLGWASRLYQKEGNIGRMINTGFHTDKIWQSVLFQLIYALLTLQIHGLYYNNFSLEDNVFIKDLAQTSAVTSYWKYKINGIDYYIPNYGYLTLLDSSFKDIPAETNTILKSNIKNHKIYSNMMKADSDPIQPDDEIKANVFEHFKNSVNINAFDKVFIQNGGCRPPPDTVRLIESIFNEASSNKDKNIDSYIFKFMRQFMNNRIGTYLREPEIPNVRKDGVPDFIKGNIVVYEEANDIFRFVLFVQSDVTGKAQILTKENATHTDIIDKLVPLTSLFAYSQVEPIVQNFKANEADMNEENLLETYVIGN